MKPPVSVVAVLSALVVTLLTPSSFAQGDGLILGQWTLSLAKSVYNPGPPPKSQVRTYSREGDALKAVIETVQTLGAKTRVEYTARYDGRDYPLSGNSDADTIALTRVDNWTFNATLKRRGKVVTTVQNTISKDGRTMTITAKGTTARGQPNSSTTVYIKQ